MSDTDWRDHGLSLRRRAASVFRRIRRVEPACRGQVRCAADGEVQGALEPLCEFGPGNGGEKCETELMVLGMAGTSDSL